MCLPLSFTNPLKSRFWKKKHHGKDFLKIWEVMFIFCKIPLFFVIFASNNDNSGL